jgi:hypothetical protein
VVTATVPIEAVVVSSVKGSLNGGYHENLKLVLNIRIWPNPHS